MRCVFILVGIILFTSVLQAQPAGYVPGTQVCWTFNGRAHGYFKAAGNGERHILISFTGDGETNCTNFANLSPQKWITLGWDGRTVRAPGDTIVWEIFTFPNNTGYLPTAFAQDIDTFFKRIAPIDTSNHFQFHMESLSGGVGRMWGYLVNDHSHNSPYRFIFSTTISQAGVQLGPIAKVGEYSINRRHWVWYGLNDNNGGTPAWANQMLYDSLRGPKKLTWQVGGGHNSATWDSCMSLRGTDTLTNRWLWMVDTGTRDTVPPPKPPEANPYPGGGDSGYVPGTQVCWTYKSRPHGYFRAAGNGERHILVVFSPDSAVNCTNYQLFAPAKLLNDSGYNWNGRTVRAPGDTLVWEILTIPYNSGYWLPNYANDISYFFNHIYPVDTIARKRIHIAGVGGGATRMWGFLGNDQSHNSPYRHVFSTTISVASPWMSNYSLVKSGSKGRKNWVWYSSVDSYAPSAANQAIYDSLSGYRKRTILGAGSGSLVYDSCWQLSGTDTTTNRWLWMAATDTLPPAGTRLASVASGTAERIGKTGIYPNPVTNTVLITLPSSGQSYTIRVFDIAGRLTKTIQRVKDATYRLDVSALKTGMYIIEVESPDYKTQQKILKQ